MTLLEMLKREQPMAASYFHDGTVTHWHPLPEGPAS